MSIVVHVLLGIVLSFIGSIPFGTINVTVIETAILRGFRAAFWVILGASIIEFIQVLVALNFADFITRYPITDHILFWSSIPIFIGLGIYYLRREKEDQTKPQIEAYSHGKGFLKGVIVSSLNLLAIPYWIFYGSYLTSIKLIDTTLNANIIYFSLGSFVGMVAILIIYAKLGLYAKAKFNRITQFISPGIGYFCFALAVIQIARGIIKIV